MTHIVDASLVVSALVDAGPTGRWADSFIEGGFLAAPHLMPVEAANILRRAILAGDISEDAASMAYADLLALRVDLFPLTTVRGAYLGTAQQCDELRCVVRRDRGIARCLAHYARRAFEPNTRTTM